MNTKNISINDIDFKELAKSCKTEDDLSSLTKQFMKSSEKGNLWLKP